MVKRNNSNNERGVDNPSKKRDNPIRKLGYGLAIFLGLLGNPENIDAQHYKNDTKEQTEQVTDYDMINNIEQRTGVKLPAEYEKKVRDFINYSDIFKDEDVRKYTEDFIIHEMERDWGYDIDKIDKQILIRSGMATCIINQDIYDGTDGDEKRLDAFVNTADKVDDCGDRFRNGLIEHMKTISLEAVLQSEEYKQQSANAKQQSANAKQQSANAKQQSADAKQQSANAKQQSADAKQQSANAKQQSADAKQEAIKLDYLGLKEICRFYKNFKENPKLVKEEEFQQAIKVANDVIENCKKYEINYRDIILKEVGGSEKEAGEILKFYGVKE